MIGSNPTLSSLLWLGISLVQSHLDCLQTGLKYLSPNLFSSKSFNVRYFYSIFLYTKRFGRKKAYLLCILFLACVVTSSAFAMHFITFCILRMLAGACNNGIFEIYFVWGKILIYILIFLIDQYYESAIRCRIRW